jgi:uncharacterized protein YfeS
MENGSEAAKKIMKSNFYYDPLDSWSPFGNDIGNDTYYLYCDWKKEHPNENIKRNLWRKNLLVLDIQDSMSIWMAKILEN